MKRSVEREEANKAIKTSTSEDPNSAKKTEETVVEMGEFEDPYGDDFESEEEVFEAGEEGDPEDLEDVEGTKKPESGPRVYIPHRSAPLAPGERMEPDYSTYVMLHRFNVRWPCMSFDILRDGVGAERRKFPHEMYIATGTQAAQPKENEISVIKLSTLTKTLIKDGSDDESDEESDDEDADADPVLESRDVKTNSTTNRFRASVFGQQNSEYLGASMMESGEVHIWDLTMMYRSLEKPTGQKFPKKPIHTIKAHGKTEGYAIAWSPLVSSGSLLTGDCDGKIYNTVRQTQGWQTGSEAYVNPVKNASIEDLQWSPAETNVFASCGSDGHVRIWDLRTRKAPALSVKASKTDVNVISWNTKAGHLLASGHDDGSFSVWDLRRLQAGGAVAEFDFHKQAVTSIEWSAFDESALAVASEDSTVSLWDLSVEADDEEVLEQHRAANGELDGIPPQMLFLHWEPNVKEVHWHPQIPGSLVTTGSEGFSVWKSISM